MTEISQLKYVQWRPIGVCDSGSGKERKARMFSRLDLAKVTAPNVNRGNWRQNKEVMLLILRYASEVAKLSPLTNGMASPEVSEIKLVGAVLGLDQTPKLNQESSDGKVQFFQVIFRDGKQKTSSYKYLIHWLKIFFITVGSIIAVTLISLAIFNAPKGPNWDTKRNESCNPNIRNKAYSDEIRFIRESLLMDLSRLPEWSSFREAREQCSSGRLKLFQQEQKLIKCYLSVRNRVDALPESVQPDLVKIGSCVQTLCKRRLSHLETICRRL
tara:strand:+ start:110 stop:922 length:813 start_codon:yes stop_codon:yes gene_type:complete